MLACLGMAYALHSYYDFLFLEYQYHYLHGVMSLNMLGRKHWFSDSVDNDIGIMILGCKKRLF